MKIKRTRLREIVQSLVQEAAKEGHIQKIYRQSYKDMIDTASTGGNKNTPPFTKKAAKPGKSGPIQEDTKAIYVHGYIKPESAFHTLESFCREYFSSSKKWVLCEPRTWEAFWS